ncbi:BolA/IbaG family iron-sulfur metabolism protein [Aggregatibacter actinomycetemcomitans]|uniref:BolA family protein n=1 Tax=Aggregatibacter actinomycetemcomitans TaxID=714 RepID=UPI00197BF9EA|nr:BolA/IbaG family iron-sulfur metabolism protein [Aggregatibacter actinomycetemcomitans]MBN6071172.1 BolA/IbaG family iron-sulfur metabolism protein [Aggregatibacter actinomycetemcomitans]
MTKQQELEQRLRQEFRPHFIAVENESYMHSSGWGADSHFKVVLVSDLFEGIGKVARHRKIYQFLAQDLQQGIHALALHLYTLSEWEVLGQQFPKSPNCTGVGQ